MPSLKTVKNRIKSVKSTQKITKAMKMVAASKLKHAREHAEATAPYADKMEEIVQDLASEIAISSGQRSLLNGSGQNQIHLMVICAADRGLCGGFNSSLIKGTKLKINALIAQGKQVKLFCIGKKSKDMLKMQYGHLIIEHIEGIAKKGINFTDAEFIAQTVLGLFEQEMFDCCHIIYNKFKSVITQIFTAQQIIPLPKKAVNQTTKMCYDFEPSEEVLLESLLPKNISVQIFRALQESYASEQGARMSAMESATKNSGEMLKKLNLIYNRTRQSYITKELIEVISGARASNA